jgi:hypothetical protein
LQSIKILKFEILMAYSNKFISYVKLTKFLEVLKTIFFIVVTGCDNPNVGGHLHTSIENT